MLIYFTLDNKSNLIDIPDDYTPKFVNPFIGLTDTMNRFMCHLIQKLRLRNFKVDGIDVNFLYSSVNNIFISTIQNDDFILDFSSSGIYSITIPKIILQYYDDTNSYTMYRYAGDNWDEDKQKFMRGVKCNSKLRGDKKTYIRYGNSNKPIHECTASFNHHKKISRWMKIESALNESTNLYDFTALNRHNSTLICENDLDREYSADCVSEPYFYSINDILFEVYTWLYNNVYKKIEKTELAENIIPYNTIFEKPEKISINNDFKNRIIKYNLEPLNRYDDKIPTVGNILLPSLRFISLSEMVDSSLKYHDISYDACFDINPSYDSPINADYLNINLKYANHVYVYDSTLNDINDIVKSIIPINDYDSNYEKPRILVKRGLYQEEYEVIKNKKPNKTADFVFDDDMLNF